MNFYFVLFVVVLSFLLCTSDLWGVVRVFGDIYFNFFDVTL